jgi:hypothetical protein
MADTLLEVKIRQAVEPVSSDLGADFNRPTGADQRQTLITLGINDNGFHRRRGKPFLGRPLHLSAVLHPIKNRHIKPAIKKLVVTTQKVLVVPGSIG